MKPVGYIVNYPEGQEGDRGPYYNYILAANGLFIEAENKLIAARIPVAECEVRGLAPINLKVKLTYGSIPQRFFDLALDTFLADPTQEHYVAVTVDAGYHFYVPVQDREDAKVVYKMGDDVVLDIHSHGDMPAWFSPQDNRDEVGFKLYGVVGNLLKTPVVRLRIGVYGYFYQLMWAEVFDGELSGAVEHEEEVMKDELPSIPERLIHKFGTHSGWLRRNWWLYR